MRGYCLNTSLCSTSILQISGRTCNIMKSSSRFALLNIGILNLYAINRTHTIVLGQISYFLNFCFSKSCLNPNRIACATSSPFTSAIDFLISECHTNDSHHQCPPASPCIIIPFAGFVQFALHLPSELLTQSPLKLFYRLVLDIYSSMYHSTHIAKHTNVTIMAADKARQNSFHFHSFLLPTRLFHKFNCKHLLKVLYIKHLFFNQKRNVYIMSA